MRIFFDTSALAKRYVLEKNSFLLESYFSKATEVGISIICISEMISTLNRLVREKKINKIIYHSIKVQLEKDIKDMFVVNISQKTIQYSIKLLEKYKLRGMDSLHIANAMEWKSDLFLTFDENQKTAAEKFGLKVKI